MKTQDLFRPGQSVIWGERDETMKWATKDEGPGPFKILTVEEVPDNCNCGEPMTDEDGWPHMCPYKGIMGYGKPLRESVGHTQLVTIDDGTGKPLTTKFSKFSDKERVRRFNGAYFKAA